MYRAGAVMANCVGDRIRLARRKAGLSQQKLGELSELNIKTICNYEKSHRSPDIDALIRISNALGCGPGYFLTGEIDPTRLDANERQLVTIFKSLEPLQQRALLAVAVALEESS